MYYWNKGHISKIVAALLALFIFSIEANAIERAFSGYSAIERNQILDNANLNSSLDKKFDEILSLTKANKLNKSEITIAIIDTGIDVNHEFFKNVSFIDNKDFVDGDSIPNDNHGHGSHIAGIIHSIVPQANLMVLRYYDEKNTGKQNMENTIKAFEWAINHGADIINYSAGGNEPNGKERELIEKAQKSGILVVAAAGNDGQKIDERYTYYPASYNLDNIISVASVDKNGNILPSSNFGDKVDVAAPGLNVYSTYKNGKYAYMSGTSRATAFVTGAAALLKLHNAHYTPEHIKSIIKDTSGNLARNNVKTIRSGKLDINRVLAQSEKIQSELTKVLIAKNILENVKKEKTSNTVEIKEKKETNKKAISNKKDKARKSPALRTQLRIKRKISIN